MNKHLLFVVTIASLLVTCKGEDYSKELASIDSLKKVLSSADSLIEEVDPEAIKKRGDEIGNNSKFIQFNVNKLKDTLDFNTALMLTDYRAVGKDLRMMSENLEKLEKAVDSARVSSDNLSHDLTNHSLAKGIDAKASVESETEQIGEMHAYAKEMVKKKKQALESYDTLLPKVNSFVQQMSAKLDAGQTK